MILFFVRRYNDIDHTTPVVYRMFKDGYKDIAVLALNPEMEIDKDFRLKFLRDECNVVVDHVHQFFLPTVIHRFFAKLVCSFGDTNSSYTDLIMNSIKKIFKMSLGRYHSTFLNKFVFSCIFGQKWACNMMKQKKVTLLVFDWHKVRRANVSSLVEAGKELNIPILAIPHGVELSAAEIWTTAMAKTGKIYDFGDRGKDYDKIIIQHEPYKRLVVRGGVLPEKIRVLGVARFCSEWESILFNIIPPAEDYRKVCRGDKLRVVFMDHSSKYLLNVDETLNTVERLKKLDFVDLVIKPSTSSEKTISSMKLYEMAKVDPETSSVELIRWADVVMGNTSSILLEPLLMGKVFIYLKYLHSVRMFWDVMNACWVVNNYEELENALKITHRNPSYRPYSQENVDKFITEIVYGGVRNRDVLGGYKDFIISLSEEQKQKY
jgi:hypothetical protein